MNKKKLAIILIAVIVVVIGIIIISSIYKENENREKMYRGIDSWVNGGKENGYIGSLINEYGKDDEELVQYLKDATYRCKDDIEKLNDFTKTLYSSTQRHYDAVQEVVDDIWNNLPLDEKLENSEKWRYNRYMDSWKVTYQDIEKYIEEHGEKEIYTDGQDVGYYAGKTEYNDKGEYIGGTPLHDGVSVSYHGDFERICYYGVELNQYYEETSYSRVDCYFRGTLIEFDVLSHDFIYSGDYLFAFSNTTFSKGKYKGYAKITE